MVRVSYGLADPWGQTCRLQGIPGPGQGQIRMWAHKWAQISGANGWARWGRAVKSWIQPCCCLTDVGSWAPGRSGSPRIVRLPRALAQILKFFFIVLILGKSGLIAVMLQRDYSTKDYNPCEIKHASCQHCVSVNKYLTWVRS